MSYLKAYVEGKLPVYNPPPGAFTIGTNAVGVVAAIGRDVWHLRPGQRVMLSSHFAVRENVDDPAQIPIGLTAIGAGAEPVLADWPDGTLAQQAARHQPDPPTGVSACCAAGSHGSRGHGGKSRMCHGAAVTPRFGDDLGRLRARGVRVRTE